jgi:murein DD-endopeptidase MepM/ murein hydrolase activator NlpD
MSEIDIEAEKEKESGPPYGGYLLPWARGEPMVLAMSVGHDRYTPSGSAHYAFDFAKPGFPSEQFNVHAAKGGTVCRAVWHHPDGNEQQPNYIVIEDITTEPTTYQLYLSLAADSIPEELREPGATVEQGQFIGVAGDTGISTGNHIHFMVHANPSSYWGSSLDITFVDVLINGGRPRVEADLDYCRASDLCTETQSTYTSGGETGFEQQLS